MPLIVIEGLDGSGKATSAALLEKRLTDEGKQTLKISFPDYESESSALVKMYLSGKFGDKPQDVNAYAASAFYAVDRYAGYKSSWGKKLMQRGMGDCRPLHHLQRRASGVKSWTEASATHTLTGCTILNLKSWGSPAPTALYIWTYRQKVSQKTDGRPLQRRQLKKGYSRKRRTVS